MNATPQKQVSYDPAAAEYYNDGNGFTPIASNTRGSVLFQNGNNNGNGTSTKSTTRSNRKEYNNGGAAAGRSCLVVPSFGSAKKKKKKDKTNQNGTPPRPPKNRTGGLFGRGPPSPQSVSTTAESSMADPYQTNFNHNDKTSLLKSYNKKKERDNKDARDWFLETMVEVDEGGDQQILHNYGNSDSNHHPLQFGAQDQRKQKPYSQFTPPPERNNLDNRVQNSNDSSTNALPNLLQLPKAEDRSHEARSQQERMHAYQGELEPEGVRGQEATITTRGKSSDSYEIQQSSSNQDPVMRDFSNSNYSESSSQLLPIHQVVSNRQRQIQNSLLKSQGPDGKVTENEGNLAYRARQSSTLRTRFSPVQEERMSIASSAFDPGQNPFPQQQNDYNGYDEDVEHEEMVSQNRAEFERENMQQKASRQISQQQLKQRGKSLFMDADNERMRATLSVNSRNESINSDASRSSRRSAPVNIDDSSFENPLDHIQGIHAMAMEHVTKGEFDLALQAFKQVLKVYIKEHGENHPLTASAHHNLGTVHTKRAGLLPEHTLHQRHCREQALQCFQAAARSARDCPTLGPNHPNVAVSLVRIGFLLLQSQQYKNAVITFEEALRIRKENYGLHHGLVANLFNNLGVCHMHLQQFPEGRKQLQHALVIQKELLVQQDDNSSTALLELADTLCNIGGLNLEWIRQQGPDARHTLDADSAFVEALELRSKVLGEDHALTNQVRSLHDMVRSLPVPTSFEKSANTGESENSRLSWSPSHSATRGKTNPYGGNNSPGTISEMTTSVATGHSRYNSSKQNNRDTSFLSSENLNASGDMIDTSALSIPPLKLTSGESFFPMKNSSLLSNHNASNQFIDNYDATEESCLLRKPTDEEQSASQAGGFVTYAKSTVSFGSDSNHNESDRMATMRRANDLLDSHQKYMYSPDRNNRGGDAERIIDERDGTAEEDGLVPLGGDWPGPKTISRLSQTCLQNPSENLHIIHNCAVSYLARGRHSEAVALLEMVVECQKTKNGPIHAHVGSAIHNVGIGYLRSEIYYKAFQSFEEAVRVRKAALGREHPEVAVSLVKFGISLMLLQRHEDSIWIFRDALSIRKQALGDLHPSNARICNNIGCANVELGELDEARNDFEAALDIQRNSLLRNSEDGPMIFGASTTLQNLGYLYGKQEMFEKSAMVFRESLGLQERIMPKDHPTVLITLESLAETCLDARRFPHALKYYRELFERSQSVEPLDCMKQATTLQTIATIHGYLDDPKSQKKKLEMALSFVRSMDSVTSFRGGKEERDRIAFEKRLEEELEVVKGDVLSKENRKKWV